MSGVGRQLILALTLVSAAGAVGAVDVDQDAVAAARSAFIDYMATTHEFDREMLARTLGEAVIVDRVLEAISRTGTYRVLDSLSTLAFAYPPRSPFFTSELEAYLLLAREEGIDPLDTRGSYAGAMGAGQFISSSFRAYAVDGNGD